MTESASSVPVPEAGEREEEHRPTATDTLGCSVYADLLAPFLAEMAGEMETELNAEAPPWEENAGVATKVWREAVAESASWLRGRFVDTGYGNVPDRGLLADAIERTYVIDGRWVSPPREVLEALRHAVFTPYPKEKP